MKTVLVTGGAGFIGCNFVRYILDRYPEYFVVNLDKLTYAGVLKNLYDLEKHPRYFFVRGDICDRPLLDSLFHEKYKNWEWIAVINFAAESHVDRSILDPEVFLKTNVYGTGILLDAAKAYWDNLEPPDKKDFRYIQVSTDEVYGSLGPGEPAFTESSPLLPNSPYAAGKAGGDHVVRAYHKTYGFPALITRCSNNYGPYQFPEKLIPLMISHIYQERPLPVYGDGRNVRDWIHVFDHCCAVDAVWHRGTVGDIYNIGAENEWANIDIVEGLCDVMDQFLKRRESSRHLIRFVKDRLGHDWRYGLNTQKIQKELGWSPRISFKEGLYKTVCWYLEHPIPSL